MAIKRTIGSFGILFTAVSSMVGSGWLFGPYYAATIAGPAAILSWILGGILMMFIGMTFAELATMLPVTGAAARFSHFSHGALVSFTIGICSWLGATVIAPIETMALIQYSSSYFPWLVHMQGTSTVLSYPGMGVGAVLLLSMCFINYFGIKWVSRVNNLIVFFKLSVPLVTLIALFFINFDGRSFTDFGFSPFGIKGILTALPAAGIVFSFIGFNSAIQLAGETKKPEKMIPIAVLGSILIAIVLYTLIQVAFIGAVEPDPILGWKELSFTKGNAPFVTLALSLNLIWLSLILYADAVISPFGTALMYTSVAGRVNYALSQNGYMPKSMQSLSKRGVPFKAILFNFCVGILMFLPFPGWQSMVEFLVSSLVLSYAVGPIALYALRKKLPRQKRPFKVPFALVTSLIAFYICNLLAFWAGWSVIWRILAAIGIGYVFLGFYKRKNRSLDLFYANSWWLAPYLLGLGALSYLGSFKGGIGLIPFGWDFLLVGFFSLIIFYLAEKMSLQGKHMKEMLAGVIDISHQEAEAFLESE